MDAALHAIAEPSRRRILEILEEVDELSSGEIAAHFRQTPAAVSQHLGVLEQARLVSIRREGARRLYRLRPEGFIELRAYFERFWSRGLGRLKSVVEANRTAARTSLSRSNRRTPSHGSRREPRRRRR